MPAWIRPSARRRSASARIALALYVAVSVVVPVAHARAEVLSSRPEVEAQHTRLCPRIHTEATCLVCSAFQFPSPLLRGAAAAAPAKPAVSLSGRPTPPPKGEACSPHAVRAPPAS